MNAYSVLQNNTSALRWLIALIVVMISLLLTMRASALSTEWEAVFLVVIGYYFKDRPAEDRYRQDRGERALVQVMVETTFQFALAWLLVIGTFIAFVAPSYKSNISGGWIGAVALAIGFYFKDIGIADDQVERIHQVFRALLALSVTILTPGFLWMNWRRSQPLEIPLQWIGIVFIVVTFYFKERRATEPNRETVTDGL
jgi:hypothetical protein